jgi:hypothetical protein
MLEAGLVDYFNLRANDGPLSRDRFFYLLLVCVACFSLRSCPKSATTQSVPTGRSVQIVETTGDHAMLLQAQPAVSFTAG